MLKKIFILNLLLLLSCGTSKSTLRKIPDSKKKIVLIENFKNNSVNGAKWNPWEIGFPGMIEDDFLMTGFFKVVSDQSRASALKEYEFAQSGITDLPREDPEILGAEYILNGQFTVTGDTIIINARLIHRRSSKIVSSKSAAGNVHTFFTALKLVSTSLLKNLDFDLTHNELALIENNIETKNVDASLLNYKGEAYLLLADAVSNKKGMQNDVRQLKSKAKEQFKGALDRDPGYEKAKANLSRTVLMLPSSI